MKIAKQGIDFIVRYGMNDDGDFYFSTTSNGNPLIQPYNIFSDCFAAMAFSQYGIAAGDEVCNQPAVQTYYNI